MFQFFNKTMTSHGLFSTRLFGLHSVELRSVKIHSQAFLTQVQFQLQNCLTTSTKPLKRLTSLHSSMAKNVQTRHSWHHKRYFHSFWRQSGTLRGAGSTKAHLTLQARQSMRTISTSSVLASTSSTNNEIMGQASVKAATESSNNAIVVQQLPSETFTELGMNEATNSLTETAVSGSLLFPDFPIIRTAEHTIQKLHEVTGLPWWATITLTAVTLRMILIMPLSVYALHNAEKLGRLQPEIVEISKRLKQEVSMAMHEFKWDEKKAKDEYIKNMKRLIKDLQIKNNFHPLKSTASFWLQFPLWVSISYSLRNMTARALNPELDHHDECKGLTDEGTLWFSDLALTDSTWILPVLMGCVTLFNIEMAHLNISEQTKYRKRLTLFLRCLALVFIPISSTMPSAMVFYWVNSGILAAAQNLLHDHSRFRRLVGLGPSLTESTSPLKALRNRAKQKYFDKK